MYEKKLLTTGVMGSEVPRPPTESLSDRTVISQETVSRSRL